MRGVFGSDQLGLILEATESDCWVQTGGLVGVCMDQILKIR